MEIGIELPVSVVLVSYYLDFATHIVNNDIKGILIYAIYERTTQLIGQSGQRAVI